MNQLQGWFIPMLTACLLHGALAILPINFEQKNDQTDHAAITFRLVSLPYRSPSPSIEEEPVSPPEKKPPPPKEVSQDKTTSTPPRPIARAHNKAREKTELPQSAIAQEAPIASSNVAAMQLGGGGGAASAPQMPSDPVMLSSELSVICPVLNAPAYPHQSRQLGESGKLMLKLGLDENGRVKEIQVINSSGYHRLDEAAIAAVKTWRCNPPLHNGQPVRAIALQSFSFVLQE